MPLETKPMLSFVDRHLNVKFKLYRNASHRGRHASLQDRNSEAQLKKSKDTAEVLPKLTRTANKFRSHGFSVTLHRAFLLSGEPFLLPTSRFRGRSLRRVAIHSEDPSWKRNSSPSGQGDFGNHF